MTIPEPKPAAAPSRLAEAQALFAAQRYPAARRICEDLIAANPAHGDAIRLLALIEAETGQIKKAITTIKAACDADPANTLYKKTQARLYWAAGSKGRALAIIAEAVLQEPDNTEFKTILVTWVRTVKLPGRIENLKQALGVCLSDTDIKRELLTTSWISFLLHAPDFRDLHDLAACNDYDSFRSLVDALDLASVLCDPLLLSGLPVLPSFDVRLETALTRIRRFVLEESAGKTKTIPTEFLAALALHCFQNEYVFAVTPREAEIAESLRHDLEFCTDFSADEPQRNLCLYGCFHPLVTLRNAAAIAEQLAATSASILSDMIRRQIAEPLTERNLKPSIPSLTAIKDSVSGKVRDQYEENPYPRWLSLPQNGSSEQNRIRAAGKTILNAGSGTGQAPISAAIAYPGSDIVAVDLSLASLAYGKRKAREMGISNIDFRQGDILELESWDRRFDVIMCNGVLHHMDDPRAGWRVLRDLLKPRGAMYISLYSELARLDITAARHWAAENKIPPTPEGIREFRQQVFSADEGHILHPLARRFDLYSLSNCRDLVLHVQEHRFTCLQLSESLAALDLVFLEFSGITPQMKAAYRRDYPKDETMTNLRNWHAAETKTPTLFKSMYTFWCCRIGEDPGDNVLFTD